MTVPVVLEVENMIAKYGPIQVLHDINMRVNEAEIVSLLGSNGAGKTTLLNCICGLHQRKQGVVKLFGQDVSSVPAEKMISKGMAHVPERRQIFSTLTVEDNLWLGASYRVHHVGKKEIKKEIEDVYRRFPILGERKWQMGGTLSGGQQQMLAIGRALLSRPKLLLLDEPSLGLAPLIAKEILQIVQEIRNEWGTTILLVEQNAVAALAVSDRAYVLHTGEVMLEGTAAEVVSDPRVQSAYLGQKHA
ncbi:ABC transporter ATP-binding protein [Aneurinibacillus sp. REN35]|uniref:ABC transporter ATP-binding protein n=1 Tax=Aneurinibacillus sp. REN35 TaxID=3237286 RepID=UPI0035294004